KHRLRRREHRQMFILHPADLTSEVAQIIAFGEAGKLRDVVQPDVDDLPGPGSPEPIEEVLRRGLGEADGEDLHVPSPPVTWFRVPSEPSRSYAIAWPRIAYACSMISLRDRNISSSGNDNA